ncbi:hypothetical protein, unlikely [Trypanosoma brucei gambiense DAL972]|uniref:Uncharacterized protein n=1 Tax=Trypanosoma brucei gambiense (strain MHOM/CI/86/DAL972) TaxID=679716 RepID=D0A3X4_TRYB9|nr:hypothetical protein, unlikely [Trypanosoma brucei gambiense DAL972]CBH15968.1 hypothetical protein, unlikely [Trypanosoma brucei gambiense DAL972]|eukprot:XP_011778232.1 hypothetical protein, unlikely [Trypanosoma brucei gambiense DAL972]
MTFVSLSLPAFPTGTFCMLYFHPCLFLFNFFFKKREEKRCFCRFLLANVVCFRTQWFAGCGMWMWRRSVDFSFLFFICLFKVSGRILMRICTGGFSSWEL